jgi:uncharacterized protein (DUF362 family)
MTPKDKLVLHPEYKESPMNRRTFIRRMGVAGAIAAGAGYLAFAPENFPFSRKDVSGARSYTGPEPFRLKEYRVDKPKGMIQDIGIAFGKGEPENAYGRYSPNQQRTLLKAALDAVGGIRQYVEPGDIVLLKPDVAYDRSYTLGATSNPFMVGQMVRILLEDAKALEVRVADNPIESPADCFRKTGIRKAVEAAGGRVYVPDDQSFRMLNTPNATLIEDWLFFARPFDGVNKVIGMPAIKDHHVCKASISLKNWTGLLGGPRNKFNKDIHEFISDLSIMMKPTLTVIDGTQVLFENGPTGGRPENVRLGNVVMAGLDQVAMDAWAFEHLLGRGKDYPEYLEMAERKGGGTVNWEGRIKEVTASVAAS